jgi:hypothetical protein
MTSLEHELEDYVKEFKQGNGAEGSIPARPFRFNAWEFDRGMDLFAALALHLEALTRTRLNDVLKVTAKITDSDALEKALPRMKNGAGSPRGVIGN